MRPWSLGLFDVSLPVLSGLCPSPQAWALAVAVRCG